MSSPQEAGPGKIKPSLISLARFSGHPMLALSALWYSESRAEFTREIVLGGSPAESLRGE